MAVLHVEYEEVLVVAVNDLLVEVLAEMVRLSSMLNMRMFLLLLRIPW